MPNHKSTISRWVRAGVLFNASPAKRSPDLERLLIDTAREVSQNPRLFVLVVSWLVEYGSYIARHRLKHLAIEELDAESQAVLGLVLESAIENGAIDLLRVAASECQPIVDSKPLFLIDRDNPVSRELVKESASHLSRHWNLLAQPIELKSESIRPAVWILKHNPRYKDRALRKGDLRCSIVETMNEVRSLRSESELSRRCSATLPAIRAALDALEREGMPLRQNPRLNNRDQPIAIAA